MGFLYDPALGIDAGNLVYNMVWATLLWASGLGSTWYDACRQIPDGDLPPRPRGIGWRARMHKWLRIACTPQGMQRQVPDAWKPGGAWCTRHRAAPTAEYMAAVLGQQESAGNERALLIGLLVMTDGLQKPPDPLPNPVFDLTLGLGLTQAILLVRAPPRAHFGPGSLILRLRHLD